MRDLWLTPDATASLPTVVGGPGTRSPTKCVQFRGTRMQIKERQSMRSSARAIAVLCLAAALVAVGCGSSNSFKDKYNEKAKEFTKLGPDVQTAVRTASTKSG